jgi:hypothetical protein
MTGGAEKILRTAPELERLILNELNKAAICDAISAVTIAPVTGRTDTNWELVNIYVPGGGAPPRVCVDICAAAVETLRERFDLLLDIEVDEL